MWHRSSHCRSFSSKTKSIWDHSDVCALDNAEESENEDTQNSGSNRSSEVNEFPAKDLAPDILRKQLPDIDRIE